MFRVDKGIVGNARAYIGIEVKGCASSNVQTLIASTLGCRNGSFKKDLCAVQRLPGTGLNTSIYTPQVDLLANFNCLNIYTCTGLFNNGESGLHDFGSDAISISHGDWCSIWFHVVSFQELTVQILPQLHQG